MILRLKQELFHMLCLKYKSFCLDTVIFLVICSFELSIFILKDEKFVQITAAVRETYHAPSTASYTQQTSNNDQFVMPSRQNNDANETVSSS